MPLDPAGLEAPDFEAIADQIAAGIAKKGGGLATAQWFVEGMLHGVALVLAFLFQIVDRIALMLGEAFIKSFNEAAQGPLETILTLAADEFREAMGGSGGGRINAGGAAEGIASTFVQRIISETPGSDEFGLEPTLEPAKAFVGMLVEVGLRGWALDLLAELDSFGLIHAFEDLIGTISRTMGFGRLTRIAFKPIMDATIGASATAYVNRQYRPKLLGEGVAAKLVIRGIKDQAWLDEELGRQGYAADRLEALINEARRFIPLGDLHRSVRWGIADRGTFDTQCKDQGILATDAAIYFDSLGLAKQEALAEKQLEVALTQLHDGILDLAQFQSLLGALHIPVEDQNAWTAIATMKLALPRRGLTVAQLNQLLSKNLVTLGEYRDRLEKFGYPVEDAILMELLQQSIAHDKESAAEQRKQIKAQREADAKRKAEERAAAAAQRKAELEARRKAQQEFILAKQHAASDAAIARIKFTQDAITERHTLIDQASKDKLLTDEQAAAARSHLQTIQAEHTAQASAHSATMAALDTEQTAIDASAASQKALADKVSVATAAAAKRADLEDQLLTAQQADRVAGYELARQSAQASFDAGEITAAALAKKLRTIDLQDHKDQAAEDARRLELERARASGEAAAAKGQADIAALAERTQLAPAASRRRQDAIAAALADHLTTITDVSSTRTQQLADLAARRNAAVDAAAARRATLDQQLTDQRIALEQQIAANRPPPPPV